MTDLTDAEFNEAKRWVYRQAFIPREVVDAIDELQRHRAEDAWRPIEEAPRDGTEVQVGNRNHVWQDSRVIPGLRSKDGMPINGRDWTHVYQRGTPTHFRPLLQPPEPTP